MLKKQMSATADFRPPWASWEGESAGDLGGILWQQKRINQNCGLFRWAVLAKSGKNMTVLEYENDMIVVDVGSIFPSDDMPGVDLVIPDIAYLEKNYEKLRGCLHHPWP